MKRACRNLIKFCIVAVLLFALSFAVSAHPGSLDSNGGHWNHSTGTYHLHEGLNTDSGTGNSTSTYSSNIYSSDNSSNSNIVWNNYANAYENNSTDESEVPIPDNTEECEQPVNDIEEFEYPVQDIEEKPSFKEKFFNFWDNILFPILKTIFWILIVFLFIILPISSGVIRSIRESKDRKAAREEWRIRSEVAAEYKDIEEENQRLSDLLKRETQKNKAMRDKFYLQNDELKQLRSIVSNTQIFLSDLYELACYDNPRIPPYISMDKYDMDRLHKATLEQYTIKKMHIEVDWKSPSGEQYKTSLRDCSCIDFSVHGRPCKHMIALALQLGIPLIDDNEFKTKKSNNYSEYCKLLEDISTLEKKEQRLESRISVLEEDKKILESEKRKLQRNIKRLNKEIES